ncbi:hypothetical protein DR864_03765 [Runella rosea]|uniref:Uncharacterized protein n=1 Tax=Runella rosea TaxID=2259595 RepID=A0A344TE38_9BACT|nr:hypothetical protein DR864_03765 [Runella rosea]
MAVETDTHFDLSVKSIIYFLNFGLNFMRIFQVFASKSIVQKGPVKQLISFNAFYFLFTLCLIFQTNNFLTKPTCK